MAHEFNTGIPSGTNVQSAGQVLPRNLVAALSARFRTKNDTAALLPHRRDEQVDTARDRFLISKARPARFTVAPAICKQYSGLASHNGSVLSRDIRAVPRIGLIGMEELSSWQKKN
jgi:hypothetical protein